MDLKVGKSMILNFKTKNFKSIKELIEIDFVANKKLNDHEDTLIEVGNEKILPLISIYGANASGKSNVIQAISAMAKTMFTQSDNGGLPHIAPYVFDEKTINEPTFFEIELLAKESKIVFRYGFECDKKGIHEEWLYQSNIDNREDETEVFYRNINENVFEINKDADKVLINEIIETKEITQKHELVLYILYRRGSKSILNANHEINASWFTALISVLVDFRTSLYFVGNVVDENDDKMLMFASRLLEEDSRNLKFANDLIKEFEASIEEIIINTRKDENLNDIYDLSVVRIGSNGDKYITPAIIESSGTKKILYMARATAMILELGGMLLYDELDIKLHPLLFRKIIRLFTNKETNPNNAQIVFSSHNIICLDNKDLRRDEIYFTEKNNNETELYSLADIKINGEVVRKDLDFGKHYLLGRFGAIPFQSEE